MIKASNPQKTNNQEAARRARATVLGLAAISVGATAGVFLPSQGEEVLATELRAANLSYNSSPNNNSESEILLPQATPETVDEPEAVDQTAVDQTAVDQTAVDQTAVDQAAVEQTAVEQTEEQSPAISPALIKHRVQAGETLWQLSQNYGVSPDAIAASNEILAPENLSVGQTLKIPAIEGIAKPQQETATALSTSETAPDETEEIASANLENSPSSRNPDAASSDVPAQPTVANEELPESTNTASAREESPETPLSSTQEQPPVAINATETEAEGESAIARIPENANENKAVATPDKDSVVIPANSVKSPQEAAQDNLVVSRLAVTGSVYQVRSGDTLAGIATRYGLSVEEIMQANGINNPNTLQVDQELKLPRSEAVRAQVSQAPTVIHSSLEEDNEANPALLAQAADQAFAIEVDSDPVITNLKEEVMQLREEYRVQRQQEPEAEPETRVSEAPTPSESNARPEEPANPEWIRQRLQKPNEPETTVFNVPVEDRRRPEVIRQQPTRTESANRESNNNSTTTQTTAENRPNEPRLMAAAPAPVQGYNRLLQLPSGQTVEPQIPPLPEGDQFLPERPQEFNGYMWPARGTLTSGYGPRWGRMHKGIDIAAPTGTPIYAAASGVVETAGWNNGGYGNLVDIRHPDGSMTRYAHNSKVLVRKGQRVEQGDQIALMGSTGYSTGPHLHFEVHPAGRGAANPMAFLPSNRN